MKHTCSPIEQFSVRHAPPFESSRRPHHFPLIAPSVEEESPLSVGGEGGEDATRGGAAAGSKIAKGGGGGGGGGGVILLPKTRRETRRRLFSPLIFWACTGCFKYIRDGRYLADDGAYRFFSFF